MKEKREKKKSTRFSVSIENGQADKRRYSQTCRTKPNSQARTGARTFSPVQLTINKIGNLTQLIGTLLYVMITHTCLRRHVDAPRDFLTFFFFFFFFSERAARARGGGGRCAARLFFFFFFPIQQTTSGIGHRVK